MRGRSCVYVAVQGFVLLFCLVGGNLAMAGATYAVKGVSSEMNDLIYRCAPDVHSETMAALISTESRGHQFAIADAGPRNQPWAVRKGLVRSYYMNSLDDAVLKGSILLSEGHTISVGLTQINDRNFKRLGLNLRQAFDACTNINAGSRVLTGFYLEAVKQFGTGPVAMRSAISAYNSGSWVRGTNEGYVDLVFNQRGKKLSLVKTGMPYQESKPITRVARAKVEQRINHSRDFAMTVADFKVTE